MRKGKNDMISAERLGEIAAECLDRVGEYDSPRPALAAVADLVSGMIGPRPGRAILERPDPVSMAFVEVLDQIVFEISEPAEAEGGRVEEYILGDLYRRLEVFLCLNRGIEHYRTQLHSRAITADDALIIRYYSLADLVPTLMSEFFEQPHLRFPILHAMISFRTEDLIGFFYEIARGEYENDLRVLAVIGLNGNDNGRFDAWEMFGDTGDADFSALICHVSGKSACAPASGCVLLFRVVEIELAAGRMEDPADCRAMILALHDILRHDIGSVLLKSRIYESLSRILGLMQCSCMRNFLLNEENLRHFIYLVDGVPVELFEQVPRLLEFLGGGVMMGMERLVADGGVHLDERSSQLSAYLMSMGFDPLLL
jgi:hypothetical protein